MPTDRERYKQAALWRQAVLPQMRTALTELRKIRDGCPDPSLERLQMSRAIDAIAMAIGTCSADLEVALERMK